MKSDGRPRWYILGALGCLGLGVISAWWHRSTNPSSPVEAAAPTRHTAAALDASAVSAPAPEPAPPPDSQETAKALQAILSRHPVVQERERRLAEKAAQGDALIPDLVQACIDHPQDDVLIVDAVEILKRIDTVKARQTLAALKQQNDIAAIACNKGVEINRL